MTPGAQTNVEVGQVAALVSDVSTRDAGTAAI
jgi:hypothetical protein